MKFRRFLLVAIASMVVLGWPPFKFRVSPRIGAVTHDGGYAIAELLVDFSQRFSASLVFRCVM